MQESNAGRPQTEQTARDPKRSLGVRVVTALVLAPLVAAGMAEPSGLLLLGLSFVLAALGFSELRGLATDQGTRFPILGSAVFVFALGPLFLHPPLTDSPIILLCLWVLGIIGVINAHAGSEGGWLQATSMYAFSPFAILIFTSKLSSTPNWHWANPLWLSIFPVWVGDTMGYFVGTWLGKTPFVRSISPKKTLEGAIAYLLFSMLVATLMAGPLNLPIWLGILAGILCGTLGQAGDLFESNLKRRAGKKDSGNILPGHGGVLDRIDSCLFAMPVVATLIYLWNLNQGR